MNAPTATVTKNGKPKAKRKRPHQQFLDALKTEAIRRYGLDGWKSASVNFGLRLESEPHAYLHLSVSPTRAALPSSLKFLDPAQFRDLLKKEANRRCGAYGWVSVTVIINCDAGNGDEWVRVFSGLGQWNEAQSQCLEQKAKHR